MIKVLTLIMLNILYTILLPNFYTVHLQHSSCMHAFSFKVENSVNPDQMHSLEAS